MKNKLIFGLILLLTITSLGFAQIKVDEQLPENERKLRNELEQDKSIVQLNSSPKVTKLPPQEINSIKLSLYSAAKSGKGIVRAKIFRSTREGDTIVNYLLVENGKIRFILDFSRDEYSSRRVYTENCESLTLGTTVIVKDERGERIGFRAIQALEIEEMKDKVAFSLQCENKQHRSEALRTF